ncbi:MAG TPA: amidophosphoribosyltransferase [Thermoanaerobaculales bacterium]|nr:amidophosphoribosyltransferase [Thermoanaerobaculales bacterium]HPA79961.1 amidophosphoribosyltransferase [Thermoanaerobaculales bacterium]
MCGVVGVISEGGRPVVRDLANGAHFLQHRGPAYAGMFVFDPVHRLTSLEKGEGLADDIFKKLGQICGDVGIAHTRYKTYGSGGAINAQPFFDPFSGIALAHNGHITNVPQIANELMAIGQGLANHCDAEPLLRVLALWYEHWRRQEPAADEREAMFKAVEEVQRRVTGAFSAVAVTQNALYAFRDPWGFRPLAIGRRERPGSLMVASETLALEQNGYQVVGHVPHGAALRADRSLEVEQRLLIQQDPRPCAFELIYFADVESTMMGDSVRSFRWRAGRALAMHVMEKAPEVVASIGLVVPIPHSPIPGAEAFAQKLEKELASGAIQYATPVSKYRYGGRIFLEETQEERDKAAMLDFRVDAKAVAGRNIFLVDDSIVRGTNASRIVRALRAAGAGKVFFGTLWPAVIDSCFQGIDTPTQSELIAARFGGDAREIAVELGVDALHYLPVDVFREMVLKGAPACMACTTGKRAVKFEHAGRVLPPPAQDLGSRI